MPPGDGKTYVALDVFTRVETQMSPIHIFCPVSACGVWEEVARKFGVSEIKITSYERVLSKGEEMDIPTGVIIVDEVHTLKSDDGKLYEAFRKMLTKNKNPFVLGLTGTPVMNRIADIFNVLALVRRETQENVLKTWSGVMETEGVVAEGARERVNLDGKPLDALIRERTELVSLLPFEAREYQKQLELLNVDAAPDSNLASSGRKASILNLCKHTTMVAAKVTAKVLRAWKLLRAWAGEHKHIVVAARNLNFLRVVQSDERVSHFDDVLEFLSFTGKESQSEREKVLTSFREPPKGSVRAKVLLLSSGAGGTAIDLTVATRVILADACNEFTGYHNDQLVGRFRRRNMTKEVEIVHLAARGTCDELFGALFREPKRKNVADFFGCATGAERARVIERDEEHENAVGERRRRKETLRSHWRSHCLENGQEIAPETEEPRAVLETRKRAPATKRKLPSVDETEKIAPARPAKKKTSRMFLNARKLCRSHARAEPERARAP